MALDAGLLQQVDKELRVDEDVRPDPYDDATGKTVASLPSGGNLTIGCGRNLFGRPLSLDEINYLLTNDIMLAYQAAVAIFPAFDTFTQNRRAAICNLLVNLGSGKLLTFRRFIAAARGAHWNTAADELTDSAWFHEVQPERRDRIVAQIRNG
jgi:lysozyme